MLAGTLLARKGRSVLLLREDGYRSSYLRNGYRFVPFSSFSDRLLKPSVFQKVSGILDLPSPAGGDGVERRTETDPSGSKREAAFQVILPEARVDLFCRPSLREGEWRREFPGELARIRTFYDELAEEHLLLKKKEEKKESFALFPVRPGSSVKRLITSALPSGRRMDEKLSSFSTEFRKFTELQLISWGSLVPERFPVPLAAYLLANEECDGLIDDLCPERLQEKALESFLRSGGRLVEIEGVEKIEKRWKKGVTLSTGGGLGIFQGKMLILNSPLHRFLQPPGQKREMPLQVEGAD